MEARNLKYIATACGGEILKGSPDARISAVCNDSRAVKKHDLFFALSGDRFDAHDFLPEVDGKNVGAVVIERNRFAKHSKLNCGVVGVDSPRLALGRLGADYRRGFDLPVIVVGGSNGKTSTKELVASVLRQKLNTVWSDASFNNDIGVPTTLLKIGSAHEAAVLEAGTNHPGEMKSLLEMIQPNLGIITSIGREHLEFFKDISGVELEEGALAEALPVEGVLFVHGDEDWAERMKARTNARVVRVGTGAGNDVRVTNIKMDARGSDIIVESKNAALSGKYRVNLLGRHQVINSLFAIAVGAELGLSREQIAAGLAACKPAKMRLQTWEWNGVTVLDDAYNANADSMRAALETLREIPCVGRRVAVLGDMAELGEESTAAHEEVGFHCASSGVDKLFAVGAKSRVIADSAKSARLAEVTHFADPLEVIEPLKNFLKPGDVLLLKASRSAKLERISDALKAVGGQDKI